MRIAFAGFQHETNTFAPAPADYHAFELGGGWPGLSVGPAIFDAIAGANIPAAGFVEAARAQGHELLPTVWCAASPSSRVTVDAFERICAMIVAGIEAAKPFDAVYLDLHGAMSAEAYDDGEGEVIRRVRACIGEHVPLVTSYDLHANTTAAMLEQADVLVAYRTYPHVDMAATGRRTMAVLQRLFDGLPPLHTAWRRIPFLIPTVWQCTDLQPAQGLYAQLEALERGNPELVSLSFTMGFPAADFSECGPVVWAHATSPQAAQQAADALYDAVCAAEMDFQGELLPADAAVQRALQAPAGQPVVIADTQDNPGAGGESDTTGLLRALVDAGATDAALGLMVDPAAALAAHAAGAGATVRLSLGGKSGVPGDTPFEAEFLVESLSDGRFDAFGPYYGGFHMDLGPSACLRLGGVRIVLASHKAQLADQAMFRYVGIEPTRERILVVKSTLHFRADFAPIAQDILFSAVPGPIAMDPTEMDWRHLDPAIRMFPGGPTFAAFRASRTA